MLKVTNPLPLKEMETRKKEQVFQNQSKYQSLMEMVPGELPRDTPLSTVKETESNDIVKCNGYSRSNAL